MQLSISHRFISRRSLVAILVPLGLALAAITATVQSEEHSLSAPLDQPGAAFVQLVSGESEAGVPPEPAAHPTLQEDYHPLDSLTPAVVAEEILRLRDALGDSPLSSRPGFQLLPLANEELVVEESPAVPVEEEQFAEERQSNERRADERRLLRDRLRGMASRPVLAAPQAVCEISGPPHCVQPYEPASAVPCPPVPSYETGMHPPYSTQPVYPQWQPVPHMASVPYPAPVPLAPLDQHVPALRQSAHQLDQIAHMLECQELFDRADQLRQVAEGLRRDARQMRAQESDAEHRHVRPAEAQRPTYLPGTYPQTR